MICPLRSTDIIRGECAKEECALWDFGSSSCIIGHGMSSCLIINAINNVAIHVSKLTEAVIKIGEGK